MLCLVSLSLGSHGFHLDLLVSQDSWTEVDVAWHEWAECFSAPVVSVA